MDKKISILVVPSDKSGVGYFRSLRPHTKLDEMYGDDFDITIDYEPNWDDKNWLSQFNIVHFHKGLFGNMNSFRSALEYCHKNNIVTIMDIDDYWNVGEFHPQHLTNLKMGLGKLITENLRLVDYVTTTTPIYAKEISRFNKNVKVFVNAIDPTEEQFVPHPTTSNRLRIGFIMGSSHEHDMEQIKGLFSTFTQEELDKIQVVLCGYDLRGTVRVIQPDGSITSRPIEPKESVWYTYEKIVTDDYRIVSPEYKEFLLKFYPNMQYPFENDEPYKRNWTRDISKYATHYNDIDVLLAPLKETDFNKYKSELKLIECGFFNKGIILSDFGPYQLGTKSMFKKGGEIDPEGNCILIDPRKAHKAWGKAIKRILKEPEILEIMKKNLSTYIKENYDLSKVTTDRAEWYKSIVKK